MDFGYLGKKIGSNLRLQFYGQNPEYVVPLEKVEELAIERLKVLRCFESVGQDYIKGSKDYIIKLDNLLHNESRLAKSFTYSSSSNINTIKEDIKYDVLSQFILSLAYCRTEELKNWFMKQEMELFHYRYSIEAKTDKDTITKFIESNKIKLVPASPAELSTLNQYYTRNLDNEMVYKVSYKDVINLVKNRRSCVIGGYAFLTNTNDIYSIVSSRLSKRLKHTLAKMRSNIGSIDEDERLRPFLTTLPKRYVGKSYAEPNSDTITAQQVSSLVKGSFPPCMEQIHNSLTRDHHLKHAGRMQYGLFLKGIGLPLVEALKFWENSFQPRTDSDSFVKKYSYNIRHNYGKEGKRVDYPPYSCVKIITKSGVNECCGCPFQTTDLDLLSQRLKGGTNATAEQIDNIVTKARNRHFQLSCRDYFKLMHGLPDDHPLSIDHPNKYFEESQKIRKAKK